MIEWSETDLLIRDAVREFIDREVRPHLDDLEHGDMPPYPVIRKLFTSFGIDALATDLFGKLIAKEKGERSSGGGGDMMAQAAGQAGMALLAVAELSKVSMGLVTTMGVSLGLGAGTILARGTTAQKERWIPPLLTFEKVCAWAITEPDAGSDAFGGMRTTVTPKEGGYVLKGQKTFITNGPAADTIVVYAKLDDGGDVPPRRRPVLTFVLDSGMEGLTQSRPFRKMGLHSSQTGELFFDDVFLEAGRLLGSPTGGQSEDGRESAKANFIVERAGVGAMALGIIDECLRLSVDYARQRELWGRRIGDFQLIQLKLAHMEVARLNVQNMVFRVLEMLGSGRQPSLAEASAIKLYCSQAATDVAMEAVQLFGGNGYMAEYRVEQLARDAKSLMIYAGSNEVQVTHIARGLLAD